MKMTKRLFGILLCILAPVVMAQLIHGAMTHIDPAGKKDINNPVVWMIIIGVFTPIAIGLLIFGWYAFRGEYDRLPHKSNEL